MYRKDNIDKFKSLGLNKCVKLTKYLSLPCSYIPLFQKLIFTRNQGIQPVEVVRWLFVHFEALKLPSLPIKSTYNNFDINVLLSLLI